MLSPVRTVVPATAPVTWDEAQAHLRLDGDTSEQALVESLIAAATDHLDGRDGILGRALVTQTWRQDFAGFDCLRLPLSPVQSIASVTYYAATWASYETTGDTTDASAVITGLADTSDYAAGMDVTGSGIPAGAKIASVDSSSQITLDANATATASDVAITIADAAQTLATSVYQVFTDARGAFVGLKPGQTWPATAARLDAVSVTFVAGYGAAADVPAAIKAAILLMVGHWYENREASVVGVSVAELPMGVYRLISPYLRMNL